MVNSDENDDVSTQIDPLRSLAAMIASSMNDRLLAAQVLITAIDGRGSLPTGTRTMLKEIPTGGVMLFRYNLNTTNNAIRTMTSQTASIIKDESDIPPFIAVDHEGGTVNRFMPGVAALPSASAYYDFFVEEGMSEALIKIQEDSEKAGREIKALGVNMNFAPVAEYLISDNSSFLAFRSYGTDPVFTALAALYFQRGMEQAGVICVVKHFPGSAGPDPHYSASVLNVNSSTFNQLIWPFAVLIDYGARAIMAAHTAVPFIDNKIASLSPVFMQDLLREKMGFDGIIISDDFIMAAAGNMRPEEAAVQSVAAGADMILIWPRDLRRTHRTFLTALNNGTLSRDRLQEAVERIVYEKLKMGLMEY